MSYQFLTVQMVEDAAANGGFVDQTAFKTEETYAFDTLVLSEPVLHILDTYKQHIRPLCNTAGDFFIITTSGTQYTAFCSAMSLLVYEAIGKYVNPTRYRQIVETESKELLSDKDQETISKDQKHSSYVAKRAYQKTLCRDVAVNGRECMQKLSGKGRDDHTNALATSLSKVTLSRKSIPNDTCIDTEMAESSSHSTVCTGMLQNIHTEEIRVNDTPTEKNSVEIHDEENTDDMHTRVPSSSLI